jgi:hypothetical protein
VSAEPFRIYSLPELSERGFAPRPLIKGWWAAGSHGMRGACQKTAKTTIAHHECVCVASGEPLFGEFEVVGAGPVLLFTGESNAEFCWSQLRHTARSYGMSDAGFDALPIHIVDSIGELTGEQFQATLAKGLRELQPALVEIDPLYPYVGAGRDAGNVFDVGSVLNAASAVTSEAGVALKIEHHLRKSAGEHPTLTDFTQAGSREWVQSWHIAWHREAFDKREQRFSLRIEVGSRYGYGGEWDLTLRLGPVDPDTLERTELQTWDICESSQAREQTKEQRADDALSETQLQLAAMGGSATAAQYAGRHHVNRSTASRRLNALTKAGRAKRTMGERREATYTLPA